MDDRFDSDIEDDRIGKAHDRNDDAADDAADGERETEVNRGDSSLPLREEEESELADEDLEMLDDDDLRRMEGPDA